MTSSLYLRQFYRLAQVFAVLSVGVGLLVLIGWRFQITSLYAIQAGLPPMPPNVALGLILLGIALYLFPISGSSTVKISLFLFFNSLVFMLGFLTLLGYLHLYPMYELDYLLIAIYPIKPFVLTPSPYTALIFVLDSIALFLLALNKVKYIITAQWLAFLPAMSLVVTFFGYAHEETLFYTYQGSVGIAIHTATILTLVNWGIIFLRMEVGSFNLLLRLSSGGIMARQVILLTVLTPVLLGWVPLFLKSSYLNHVEIESILAALLIFIIILLVLRLANKLDKQELQCRLAESKSLRHQAELAHILRVSTVGEMASGIAHELNQPLSAIANYANACQRFAKQGAPGEELLEPLAHIHKQALRASEIIRRLRRFIGKQKPNTAYVDINEVIEESILLMQHSLQKENVLLIKALETDLPLIKMDFLQIQQVLINLLQNALDVLKQVAMPREIKVSTRFLDQHFIEISVADNGFGISESLQTQIFDAFLTTKGHQGMGIGLSLCRSIVEAHHGSMSVQSKVGEGAIFRFTLPLKT
jgi:signal transduction histidine kinase